MNRLTSGEGVTVTHRATTDEYRTGWDAVFGRTCELCGRPGKPIESFDHVKGEHVEVAVACAAWPRCRREVE